MPGDGAILVGRLCTIHCKEQRGLSFYKLFTACREAAKDRSSQRMLRVYLPNENAIRDFPDGIDVYPSFALLCARLDPHSVKRTVYEEERHHEKC
jgi:hypothetical protein